MTVMGATFFGGGGAGYGGGGKSSSKSITVAEKLCVVVVAVELEVVEVVLLCGIGRCAVGDPVILRFGGVKVSGGAEAGGSGGVVGNRVFGGVKVSELDVGAVRGIVFGTAITKGEGVATCGGAEESTGAEIVCCIDLLGEFVAAVTVVVVVLGKINPWVVMIAATSVVGLTVGVIPKSSFLRRSVGECGGVEGGEK